jgi:hypothetical protein
MFWWRTMQPSWRKEGDSLVRSAPMGENWQVLRKGGTSGIYIVVMGLSWWIKAQCAVHGSDINAWTAVSDLFWVIEQMKQVTVDD